MADQFITLADLTALNPANVDSAVGIIEVVRDYAPEVEKFGGRPIEGINTYISRRKTLPGSKTTMGGTLFRNVGEGTYTEASTYEKLLQECYFLDGQLQVDEAIVKADPKRQGDILALESKGQIMAKFLGLGRSFYYGTVRDGKGMYGLSQLVQTAMTAVKGSATGASTESVFLVRNAPDGIQWLYGNGVGLQAGQWMKQQVLDSNSKPYMAYVNNFSGYLGLGMSHELSVAKIANLDDSGTAGKFITDKLIAQAIALFPIGYPPTHICMSRRQRYWLQQSRTVVSQGNLTNTLTGWPTVPVESNGVPIVVTDAISLTETAI
jgi:hypothetical protein